VDINTDSNKLHKNDTPMARKRYNNKYETMNKINNRYKGTAFFLYLQIF